MALEIRIQLNDEQEKKFLAISETHIGNKTVVKGELIEYALNRFHKKLCKPNDVIANMMSDKNE